MMNDLEGCPKGPMGYHLMGPKQWYGLDEWPRTFVCSECGYENTITKEQHDKNNADRERWVAAALDETNYRSV